MGTMKVTILDVHGNECEEELPSYRIVCPRCEGYGTHLNPSMASHAYSATEFDESFDDEQKDQYFKRGGRYDVQCEECQGEKVIDVPDEDACTTVEKKEILKAWKKYQRELDNMAREEAHERRMGY